MIRDLMCKIDSLAEAENANRVTTVRIWLGALSHMSTDHLRGHFEHAATGTIADGASLEIEKSFDAGDPNAQELLLRSVEVET